MNNHKFEDLFDEAEFNVNTDSEGIVDNSFIPQETINCDLCLDQNRLEDLVCCRPGFFESPSNREFLKKLIGQNYKQDNLFENSVMMLKNVSVVDIKIPDYATELFKIKQKLKKKIKQLKKPEFSPSNEKISMPDVLDTTFTTDFFVMSCIPIIKAILELEKATNTDTKLLQSIRKILLKLFKEQHLLIKISPKRKKFLKSISDLLKETLSNNNLFSCLKNIENKQNSKKRLKLSRGGSDFIESSKVYEQIMLKLLVSLFNEDYIEILSDVAILLADIIQFKIGFIELENFSDGRANFNFSKFDNNNFQNEEEKGVNKEGQNMENQLKEANLTNIDKKSTQIDQKLVQNEQNLTLNLEQEEQKLTQNEQKIGQKQEISSANYHCEEENVLKEKIESYLLSNFRIKMGKCIKETDLNMKGEYFRKYNFNDSDKIEFKNASVCTDGSYLYILRDGWIYIVGTGYKGTTKGKIIRQKKMPYRITGKIIVFNKRIFILENVFKNQKMIEICSQTFKPKALIQTENVPNSIVFQASRNKKHVITLSAIPNEKRYSINFYLPPEKWVNTYKTEKHLFYLGQNYPQKKQMCSLVELDVIFAKIEKSVDFSNNFLNLPMKLISSNVNSELEFSMIKNFHMLKKKNSAIFIPNFCDSKDIDLNSMREANEIKNNKVSKTTKITTFKIKILSYFRNNSWHKLLLQKNEADSVQKDVAIVQNDGNEIALNFDTMSMKILATNEICPMRSKLLSITKISNIDSLMDLKFFATENQICLMIPNTIYDKTLKTLALFFDINSMIYFGKRFINHPINDLTYDHNTDVFLGIDGINRKMYTFDSKIAIEPFNKSLVFDRNVLINYLLQFVLKMKIDKIDENLYLKLIDILSFISELLEFVSHMKIKDEKIWKNMELFVKILYNLINNSPLLQKNAKIVQILRQLFFSEIRLNWKAQSLLEKLLSSVNAFTEKDFDQIKTKLEKDLKRGNYSSCQFIFKIVVGFKNLGDFKFFIDAFLQRCLISFSVFEKNILTTNNMYCFKMIRKIMKNLEKISKFSMELAYEIIQTYLQKLYSSLIEIKNNFNIAQLDLLESYSFIDENLLNILEFLTKRKNSVNAINCHNELYKVFLILWEILNHLRQTPINNSDTKHPFTELLKTIYLNSEKNKRCSVCICDGYDRLRAEVICNKSDSIPLFLGTSFSKKYFPKNKQSYNFASNYLLIGFLPNTNNAKCEVLVRIWGHRKIKQSKFDYLQNILNTFALFLHDLLNFEVETPKIPIETDLFSNNFDFSQVTNLKIDEKELFLKNDLIKSALLGVKNPFPIQPLFVSKKSFESVKEKLLETIFYYCDIKKNEIEIKNFAIDQTSKLLNHFIALSIKEIEKKQNFDDNKENQNKTENFSFKNLKEKILNLQSIFCIKPYAFSNNAQNEKSKKELIFNLCNFVKNNWNLGKNTILDAFKNVKILEKTLNCHFNILTKLIKFGATKDQNLLSKMLNKKWAELKFAIPSNIKLDQYNLFIRECGKSIINFEINQIDIKTIQILLAYIIHGLDRLTCENILDIFIHFLDNVSRKSKFVVEFNKLDKLVEHENFFRRIRLILIYLEKIIFTHLTKICLKTTDNAKIFASKIINSIYFLYYQKVKQTKFCCTKVYEESLYLSIRCLLILAKTQNLHLEQSEIDFFTENFSLFAFSLRCCQCYTETLFEISKNEPNFKLSKDLIKQICLFCKKLHPENKIPISNLPKFPCKNFKVVVHLIENTVTKSKIQKFFGTFPNIMQNYLLKKYKRHPLNSKFFRKSIEKIHSNSKKTYFTIFKGSQKVCFEIAEVIAKLRNKSLFSSYGVSIKPSSGHKLLYGNVGILTLQTQNNRLPSNSNKIMDNFGELILKFNKTPKNAKFVEDYLKDNLSVIIQYCKTGNLELLSDDIKSFLELMVKHFSTDFSFEEKGSNLIGKTLLEETHSLMIVTPENKITTLNNEKYRKYKSDNHYKIDLIPIFLNFLDIEKIYKSTIQNIKISCNLLSILLNSFNDKSLMNESNFNILCEISKLKGNSIFSENEDCIKLIEKKLNNMSNFKIFPKIKKSESTELCFSPISNVIFYNDFKSAIYLGGYSSKIKSNVSLPVTILTNNPIKNKFYCEIKIDEIPPNGIIGAGICTLISSFDNYNYFGFGKNSFALFSTGSIGEFVEISRKFIDVETTKIYDMFDVYCPSKYSNIPIWRRSVVLMKTDTKLKLRFFDENEKNEIWITPNRHILQPYTSHTNFSQSGQFEFSNYCDSFKTGDILGVWLEESILKFTKNGKLIGNAFVNPNFSPLADSTALYMGVSLSAGCKISANFDYPFVCQKANLIFKNVITHKKRIKSPKKPNTSSARSQVIQFENSEEPLFNRQRLTNVLVDILQQTNLPNISQMINFGVSDENTDSNFSIFNYEINPTPETIIEPSFESNNKENVFKVGDCVKIIYSYETETRAIMAIQSFKIDFEKWISLFKSLIECVGILRQIDNKKMIGLVEFNNKQTSRNALIWLPIKSFYLVKYNEKYSKIKNSEHLKILLKKKLLKRLGFISQQFIEKIMKNKQTLPKNFLKTDHQIFKFNQIGKNLKFHNMFFDYKNKIKTKGFIFNEFNELECATKSENFLRQVNENDSKNTVNAFFSTNLKNLPLKRKLDGLDNTWVIWEQIVHIKNCIQLSISDKSTLKIPQDTYLIISEDENCYECIKIFDSSSSFIIPFLARTNKIWIICAKHKSKRSQSTIFKNKNSIQINIMVCSISENLLLGSYLFLESIEKRILNKNNQMIVENFDKNKNEQINEKQKENCENEIVKTTSRCIKEIVKIFCDLKTSSIVKNELIRIMTLLVLNNFETKEDLITISVSFERFTLIVKSQIEHKKGFNECLTTLFDFLLILGNKFNKLVDSKQVDIEKIDLGGWFTYIRNFSSFYHFLTVAQNFQPTIMKIIPQLEKITTVTEQGIPEIDKTKLRLIEETLNEDVKIIAQMLVNINEKFGVFANKVNMKKGLIKELILKNKSIFLIENKRLFLNKVLEYSSLSCLKKEVYINRIIDSFDKSIFLQMFSGLKDVPCKYLRPKPARKGKCDVAFIIRFENEDAIGNNGPYREIYENLCNELFSSENILFRPSENFESEIGEDRYRFVPCCKNDKQLDILEKYEFFGKLLGIALRSKLLLNLSLPSMFYKKLCGIEPDLTDINQVNSSIANILTQIKNCNDEKEFEYFDIECMDFEEGLQDHLKEKKLINFETRKECANAIEKYILKKYGIAFDKMCEGFWKIVPKEPLFLFEWNELEYELCGNPIIKIDVLKKNTIYNNCNKNSKFVQNFWTVIEELNNKELSRFVEFAFACKRLPSKDSEFKSRGIRMQIEPLSVGKKVDVDKVFPKAETCFFNVSIPKYSSVEIMREKIRSVLKLDWGMSGDNVNNSQYLSDESDEQHQTNSSIIEIPLLIEVNQSNSPRRQTIPNRTRLVAQTTTNIIENDLRPLSILINDMLHTMLNRTRPSQPQPASQIIRATSTVINNSRDNNRENRRLSIDFNALTQRVRTTNNENNVRTSGIIENNSRINGNIENNYRNVENNVNNSRNSINNIRNNSRNNNRNSLRTIRVEASNFFPSNTGRRMGEIFDSEITRINSNTREFLDFPDINLTNNMNISVNENNENRNDGFGNFVRRSVDIVRPDGWLNRENLLNSLEENENFEREIANRNRNENGNSSRENENSVGLNGEYEQEENKSSTTDEDN